ncbi:hypothetical protein LCGC14_1203720 [marine sediment metagenome]|uniref:Uncharacterized protein n=1 Tax=marine sediment metagenome TaxID=412755 RepID=A0A0F9LKJ0_9ZZZZ
MTDKHTPGPWRQVRFTVWSGEPNTTNGPVAEANGQTIEECEANAAFIVRAVNNHAKLLEALEFERQISLGDDAEAYPQFVEMRDAAIEAAKGDA